MQLDIVPIVWTDDTLYVIRTDTYFSEGDFDALSNHLRNVVGLKNFTLTVLGKDDSIETIIRDNGCCPTCGKKQDD